MTTMQFYFRFLSMSVSAAMVTFSQYSLKEETKESIGRNKRNNEGHCKFYCAASKNISAHFSYNLKTIVKYMFELQGTLEHEKQK
jgi:hypothetical protein